MGRPRKYQTEEERKEAHRASCTKWRENHKDYNAEWRKNHKAENTIRKAEYKRTQIGRASTLISSYKHEDKKYGSGESTLTTEWIVTNVFSGQKCWYCGESDWHELGVDRIDNTLPHTPDNIVPCCAECNKKKARRTYDEWLKILWTKTFYK